MRNPSIHERRNQQVLADVVRTYVETGEPVSSRAIARQSAEALSPATIRNVMADLEEDGLLYQPHTSAGRVPTAAGYRFFVQQISTGATVSDEDRALIRSELAEAHTPEEVMERASHVLAMISRGLGIIVTPPISSTVLEHIRFLALPDGRVLAVLVSRGGATRDKAVRLDRVFTQEELDRTADFLNRNYAGRTLAEIRADLNLQLTRDRERYDQLLSAAVVLCDASVLESDAAPQIYVEGAARMVTAPEFAGAAQLSELLAAIEEKKRLVALLNGCIEAPEPVQVRIGVDEFSNAGEHLALITAPYLVHDHVQGSLGVLGPMRMQYERAITAVAYMARVFGETLDESQSK